MATKVERGLYPRTPRPGKASEYRRCSRRDAHAIGISARKIMKVIKDPHLAAALLNAQLRIRSRASVPLSMRLKGKIRIQRKRAFSPWQRHHPGWERRADRAHLSQGRLHHHRRPHLHQLRFIAFQRTNWSRLGATVFWVTTPSSSTTTSTIFSSIACCRRPTRL